MSGFKINKLTDCAWLNLFEVRFTRKSQPDKSWLMCSRKHHPVKDAAKADIVVIVATMDSQEGKRLVVTKEFRVPIWDYEYGFPTGLIDDGEDVASAASRELKEETGLDLVKVNHISQPIFSSAGLTDESCHMVLLEAKGESSDRWSEDDEDIEVLLLDIEGIRDLLASNKRIAAKAWGLLYHYAAAGRIG
ncbi:MAG: NUDIX hydrolase [Phycisphaerales bacterium]|nr:MAG: NUDIX hydrolase [Phycisphaerales bacterium]